MSRPPHIRAALSAGGFAIVEHLRKGSVLLRDEIGPALASEIDYSLRSRGLALVDRGAVLGWIVDVRQGRQ